MKLLLTTLNSKYIHTCLSIRYLYSSVKDTCDSYIKEYTINESLDKIYADIYEKNYDIVGFSCYIWNVEQTLKLCSTLKEANPDLIIILGGPEVSFDSLNFINKHSYIDYIIKGEGELVLPKLIDSISKLKKHIEIDGVVYKSNELPPYSNYRYNTHEDIYFIENKDTPPIADLSQIKSPYLYVTEEEIENKIVYFETSRGCTFNCSYCLSSTLKGVRFFPLESVKQDLKKLVVLNAKQIKFVDRTFNSHKEITLALIKFLKEIDNGKINFHFEITAHMLDDEFMKEIKEARYGLFQFEIGVQSTNSKTIKTVNRIDNFEKLSVRVNQIKEYRNIHQHLDLIAGLPYENLESFKKSFNDVFGLLPEALQLGFLKMLKGSPIRSQVELFDYRYRNYPPYEVISNKFISASEILFLKEIEEIVDLFYNSGMFMLSIEYIYINNYNNNGFKLFSDLLAYKNEYYQNKTLSRDDLYKLLHEFYSRICPDETNKIKELIRFDYLRMGRNRVIPLFLRNDLSSITREEAVTWISNDYIKSELGYSNSHPMEIIKKIHVELFEFDIIDYIKIKGNLKNHKAIIAFNYSGEKDFMNKVTFTGGLYEQIKN